MPFIVLAVLMAAPESGASCTYAGRVLGKTTAYTVVALEPVRGSPALPPVQPARRVMYQRSRTFVPAVMVLRVGDWLEFENDDFEFHSVFSSARVSSFDIGTSNRGRSGAHHFEHPGVFPIQCNIHSNMHADVFVVGSSAWATVEADGTWRIEAPAGPWRVVVYAPNTEPVEQRVSTCVTGLELTVAGATVERPRSKTGEVYSPYELSN